jgi:hypothetical protein
MAPERWATPQWVSSVKKFRGMEVENGDFEAAEGVLAWFGGFGWLRFWGRHLTRNARDGSQDDWAKRGTESAISFI